ncbi:hypothetical protein DMC47_06595 [Nostoc sp. 3335mG]|nr:hypothetical protein DMC47_06595 [Nostoc sp. 3335mG]
MPAMTLSPPDLKDPAARAAYHRELTGVAAGMRRIGLLLALAGAAVALVRLAAMPDLPAWLPASITGVGIMTMIAALAARRRYHLLRTRGQG